MTNIVYVSSDGKTYNLNGKYMKVVEGNYHKYAWKQTTSKAIYGDILENFTKESQLYPIKLQFRGTISERKNLLNELINSFEHDVLTKQPGRFEFGEWHIDGYVIDSDTQRSDSVGYWSQNVITIYCPRSFWIKENAYSFVSGNGVASVGDKIYPRRYPYRYVNGMQNMYIVNPHFIDSNFKMVICGPILNPQVTIGNNTYLVYIDLEEGELLEVDSRNRTITRIRNNGVRESAYHNREKGKLFFVQIPPGRQMVSWNGQFNFDLTIYEERSEPKWSIQN